MSLISISPNLSNVIVNAVTKLAFFTRDSLDHKLEPYRLARAGYALLASGCSVKGHFPGDNLASNLVETQQADGGWSDVEETLWCLGYLSAFGERYDTEMTNGRKWLASVRLSCGAWGKSERDQPRIPVTALTSALMPKVVGSSALKWLANQWEADLASPTQLTYKGGFFLLAQAHGQASFGQELTERTVSYLNGEQEDDGGFSPWKEHPMGSDPWCTGVALWGLSKVGELIPIHTVERALSWLESRQLPNGLWPYHYLDDGAAMALIGIASTLPLLSEH